MLDFKCAYGLLRKNSFVPALYYILPSLLATVAVVSMWHGHQLQQPVRQTKMR
jgi:hypothetical protein